MKSGYGGPGPNYWSDSPQSVWVDANGWLHLKIRYENGIWYCSEVYTQYFTQYGMHRFYIISRLDSLDKNVVFAPFLYSNDTTELDIEFSKWGNEYSWFNSQYVVQPGYHPGNVERFWMSLNGTYTTHYINWNADSVVFKSIHGHYPEPPGPGYLIHEWTYDGNDIPLQEEYLRVHINLWLYQGTPPSNGQEVEVIVKDADLPPSLKIKEVRKNEEKYPKFLVVPNFLRDGKIEIFLTLPERSFISLKIYNPQGQIIKDFLNGILSKGTYNFLWNSKTEKGNSVSSGIYFIRFETPKFFKTEKVIIWK